MNVVRRSTMNESTMNDERIHDLAWRWGFVSFGRGIAASSGSTSARQKKPRWRTGLCRLHNTGVVPFRPFRPPSICLSVMAIIITS
jgi:hypothetical protein